MLVLDIIISFVLLCILTTLLILEGNGKITFQTRKSRIFIYLILFMIISWILAAMKIISM